ncbi:D-serine ammonia-lyase [Entomomonas asaccharolytica]|uniref:Probable D-serine dehydratase n=1 Tax=Entomomonas asaccharolytica TaxID=2785331 RepID=A0A974NDT0_9GAMM|nr:D-serine ammonia-lyase [Entomomonas asaccharolytica]QQP84841.1 D-serine ammonia-lyase [Entomomonas asaccharolytica]
MKEIHGKTLEQWYKDYPLIEDLVKLREATWFNPAVKKTSEALPEVGLTVEDIKDAAARLKRFSPYLAKVFPETRNQLGILESPLVAVPDYQQALDKHYQATSVGNLWLKLDSHLPISGSIKARGGIYEVLKHAEELAIQAGKLALTDDYSKLADPEFKAFFSQYAVAVGSTGNLGLSIGIMSAKLGFKASVHMSADARQWKKDKLRAHGVNVVEYDSDYSEAVAKGRKEAENDPMCYFVDDENSKNLFLGYAVAAYRLAGQLQALSVKVDQDHPLFVYLPCGVGGGPGGVAFGLKAQFGDAVHCIFSEPTHAPCMFLGVYTGLHDQTSVQDFGIDNLTAADGLAVGRPSGFVGKAMQHLLDGYFTIDDDEMYRLLALLAQQEKIYIEPSAAAGITGIYDVLCDKQYIERMQFTPKQLQQATHIAWVTGGSMVPEAEMKQYIAKGESLLK